MVSVSIAWAFMCLSVNYVRVVTNIKDNKVLYNTSSDLYLSSLESRIFKTARKCKLLKQMAFDTGKQCVLAEIEPAVIGQSFDVFEDIKYVVLTNRHEGETLYPIKTFPCFVFITRPLIKDIFSSEVVTEKDLEILAWGELYKTKYDADNHVFPKTC